MVVVFDLFGVLMSSGFSSSVDKLEDLLQKSRDEIAPIYKKWEVPFDLGKISSEEFWAGVQSDLGVATDWQVLDQAVLNSYRRLDGSFELVEQISEHQPVYLLSNTRKAWFEFLDQKFEISKRFKKVYLSCDLGMKKPEAEIFTHVLNDLGTAPSDMIFIDDQLPNVAKAQDLGIDAIQFESASTTGPKILDAITAHGA